MDDTSHLTSSFPKKPTCVSPHGRHVLFYDLLESKDLSIWNAPRLTRAGPTSANAWIISLCASASPMMGAQKYWQMEKRAAKPSSSSPRGIRSNFVVSVTCRYPVGAIWSEVKAGKAAEQSSRMSRSTFIASMG